MTRVTSFVWVSVLLLIALYFLCCLTGCGMALVPHLERGMTRREVDHRCVADCFPIFAPVQVGMHGGRLDVTYHQDSLTGYDAGQFLFATYEDDQLVDWSLMGYAAPASARYYP